MALQVMEGNDAVVCSDRPGFVDMGWAPGTQEDGTTRDADPDGGGKKWADPDGDDQPEKKG